jgi:tetratricopeptide (TPR) repeat protein
LFNGNSSGVHVKHVQRIVAILVILFAGCDRSNRPAGGPMEVFDQAVSALQQHEAAKARRLFEQAAESFKQSGSHEKQAIAHTYLAQVHLELREFRASLDDLHEAAALYAKLGDTRSGIRLAAIEGDVYAAVGQYRQAIERYRHTADAATAFDDHASVASSELNIAKCLFITGDIEAAAEHFRTAEVQFQSVGNDEGLATASLGEGRAWRVLQKWPESLNALTQAEHAIGGQDRPILSALVQAEEAMVRFAQGSAGAAVSGLRDAINTLRRQRAARDQEPILLGMLASVYERTGRTTEAKGFYQEAAEVAHVSGDRLAEQLLLLASLRLQTPASKGQGPTLAELTDQHRALAQRFHELGYGTGEAFAYVQMGLLAERVGALADAQAHLTRAVTIDQRTLGEFNDPERHLPLLRILGISAPHTEWYRTLARVLVRRDRNADALKIIELARIRELTDGMASADITIRQPAVKKQTEDVRSAMEAGALLACELSARQAHRDLTPIAAEAAAIQTDLDKIRQSIRTGASAVISAYPNYDLLVPGPPVDPGVLQRFIPRGSTVVTYLPTDERLYIFALTRASLNVRSSAIRGDSVTALVQEYQQLILDPRVYSSDAAAANIQAMTRFALLSTRLYDLLLKPAEDLFERNLIIVPTGVFEGLPFHAIERQDKDGNVRYVIETSGVDYLPSLSALRYRVQFPLRVQKVVAFGNPTGKDWSVDYELRDLRSFFRETKVMIGLETTWDNVRSTSADVLQLSTEFVGQSRIHPLGELVLSNGLTVEGSVRVRFEKLSEMSGIPVVMLSNQRGQGTELRTLHAALLRMNGTSDVFFNAWYADRRPAKFFSEYFYTHLANGLAPGDAYRQALLSLIRSREVSHQRAWGQFFHFGIG